MLYAVRPTDRDGLPVSDAVFMVLRELGWCLLVPFDHDAHYRIAPKHWRTQQMEML